MSDTSQITWDDALRSPTIDIGNHIVCDEQRPCWHCGDLTRWVELSFETPLCPGPCAAAKWREYETAERAAGPRSPEGENPDA